MLQKFAVTLLMVGLATQTTATVSETAPGFSFTSNQNANHEKLTMNVTNGTFIFAPLFCNVSAWSFTPGDNGTSIAQDTAFPFLDATYSNFPASAGNESVVWIWLAANLNTTKYRLTLTAQGNETCRLEAQFSAPEMGLELDVDSSGKAGDAFKTPEVVGELKAVVSRALAEALPAFLTDFANPLARAEVDTDKLCKEMLAAKPESFPNPELGSNFLCEKIRTN